MERDDVKRRLAAILSADVVGYSRLMGEDEEATLKTLTAYRQVIGGLIPGHQGRVVDMAGDSVLAEFSSVGDAVRCAVRIQEQLGERNAGLPEERRMHFRIGVNLGDVMVEGDHVFGDGVNVAARLEGLADPGGICLSRAVFDQVKNRLELGYEYLGERKVKNIAEPVRAYRVELEPAVSVAPTMEKTSEALALPDKPSIAVLPFTNMSEDPEQTYFSDGISEDIITELSRFRFLFVIARNSSFAYRNTTMSVQQLARELGVEYVLEGSVRKAGNKVRVTAQLVEADSGHHLWAERYDRDLEDIFQVQDEITETIVGTLAGRLEEAGAERAKRKPTGNLAAYDYVLRGNEHYALVTREENEQSRRMYGKALELDRDYARANVGLALTHLRDYVFGWSESPAESLERGFKLAQKAVALDDADSESHRVLGDFYLAQRQHEQAAAAHERALALNPESVEVLADMGLLLIFLGEPGQAIETVKKAMRLNPYHSSWYVYLLGLAYYYTGQYGEAIALLEGVPEPWAGIHRELAACYAQLGREEEARTHAAEVLRLEPRFSIDTFRRTLPFKNPEDVEHYVEGLRKAGVPE